MALSGIITGTTSNQYISSKIVWSATQNKTNNTSTVTATLYYSRTNSGYTTYGTWAGSITINGVTTQNSKYITITQNSNTEAVTATITVPHNADGSKSITIAATGGISGTSFSSTSISKSVTLDTIPRASTVYSPTANIGENTTITINKASSGFTHTISYTVGSESGTIATKTTANSIVWLVPTSLYLQTVNSYNADCKLTCITYNGSTTIGTTEFTFMLNVKKSDNIPVLAPTVEDTNSATVALTGDKNKLIKYYSSAYMDIGATAQNGATIKSEKVTVSGKSYTLLPITIMDVESNVFTFTATDSRGYSTTQTVTKEMINYVNLTANINVEAPTANGTTTLEVFGNYFNGSFGAVSNTLTVEYRYKANSGSYGEWQTATVTLNGNFYSKSIAITGLNYLNSYTFQARATDKLQTVSSYEYKVKTTPVFDWGENDFNFNVPVNHNGIIVMNDGAGIAGVDADGDIMVNFTANTSSNAVELGIGNYLKNQGRTSIYGNNVDIFSNNSVYVNGMELGANKVLWSGASQLNASQIITLSEPISEQLTGIILVFSWYDTSTSTARDTSFNTFFVSKEQARLLPNCGHTFIMSINAGFSAIGAKYLFLTDNNISGHVGNTTSGTNSGITFDNSNYVLRYVIGV